MIKNTSDDIELLIEKGKEMIASGDGFVFLKHFIPSFLILFFITFTAFTRKGMPVSKRVLKPLIENGKVSWYDDPRLPTLEALKRRGIKREAVRKFILSLGFTKADTLAPFDALESFNRKIVDAESIFTIFN